MRMVKVRVWKFKVFDNDGKEDTRLSERYATLGTIAILGGKIKPEEYICVDESDVESGMTPVGFVPKPGTRDKL